MRLTKNKMKRTLFFILFLLFGKISMASNITMVVHGIDVNQGRIYVGLYNNAKEFPDGRQKAGQFVDSEKETIRIIFTDLPDGKYAIVLFQDKNSNQKIDKNFLGIPNERYGLSGNQGFGFPDFEDAAFIVNSQERLPNNQKIEIKFK